MIFPGKTRAEVEARDRKLALEAERDEIEKNLERINLAAIRPLQSKAVNKGKPEDDAKLAALETEAEALRARRAVIELELAAL